MVSEAQALRERLLGDLARRRKLAHAQVEQLRAGRERLLEAYRVVRRTLDEVTQELQSAEVEARAAAEAAGRRLAAEGELTAEELAAVASAPDALAGDIEVAPPPAAASPPPESAPPPPPEPSPPPVETAPVATAPTSTAPVVAAPLMAPSERRSSSLRILRRARPEPGAPDVAPEPATEPVAAPVAREAVRVVPVEPPSDKPLADEPPEAVAAAEAPPVVAPVEPALPEEHDDDAIARPDIDSLFARLRADRAESVAHAEAVLGEDQAPEPVGDAVPAAPEEPAAPEPPEGEADETALQRRDELLEPVDSALVRRLKRVLQDDQNAVLDALRTARGRSTADVVLPPPTEHLDRYREVARSLLAQAAEAGSLFVSGSIGTTEHAAVDDLATALAEDLVTPLRERLARAVDDAGAGDREGDDEEGEPRDTGDVVERVNAAYREWKLQRIEPVARHAVARAFARAGFDATDDGTLLRWVVDDEGSPCPDCDDDALAGALPKGEPFPTGQLHPPAHPGCRCLLLPSHA
jgi:hypothetical protein